MQLAGLIIMGLGTFGIFYSTVIEIKYKEPLHSVMVKVFPWIFAVGAILFSLVR